MYLQLRVWSCALTLDDCPGCLFARISPDSPLSNWMLQSVFQSTTSSSKFVFGRVRKRMKKFSKSNHNYIFIMISLYLLDLRIGLRALLNFALVYTCIRHLADSSCRLHALVHTIHGSLATSWTFWVGYFFKSNVGSKQEWKGRVNRFTLSVILLFPFTYSLLQGHMMLTLWKVCFLLVLSEVMV